MRIKLFLILASAVLVMAHSANASAPDWVREAAVGTLPAYDPETEVVVLLDSDQITITAPDTYIEHHRRVVRILRPEGRDEGALAVYFQKGEQVVSLHAWSLDRSGHEFELKDKDFVERGYSFGYDLYNDVRLRTATAPAADPGSVVAFEYEIKRHCWVNQVGWLLQESFPVRKTQITVQLPTGWELKDSWAGMNALSPSQPASNQWQWTISDLPAIDHEPMRPSLSALSARLEIAFFAPGRPVDHAGSWNALGHWYDELAAGRRNSSPLLVEKTHQLIAGRTDFDAKARVLASFLQTDVRYVAIETNIGGYQPHPADQIFQVRYGDCKDKATLLSSMLNEAGISSQYVLIDTTRGSVRPEVPSYAFNHAILAIELPLDIKTDRYRASFVSKSGKRYLLFDPTDSYTSFGDLRGALQDTFALLITESGGELIHTPLLPPSANLIARNGHFTLDEHGSLTGEVTENRSGDHAAGERAFLARVNERERSQFLERRLSRSLQAFALENPSIEPLNRTDQDLVTKFKLTATAYSQTRGSMMLLRPRVLGEKGFALERKPRRYPFQFQEASRETDNYEIELPKGFTVEDYPDAVHFEADFATYQSKVEVVGSTLRYSREFVRKTDFLPIERIEELRKLLGVIGADEAAVVVLKRAP